MTQHPDGLRLTYPEDLPVSRRRAEIAAAIAAHQVVVVAGETGSGKTTQLPKICLELGRGSAGLIGHTQPRRIAARAVADRVAEELGVPLGTTVGYQVRFTDHTGPDTRVKVMTDGILLAEIQHDPMLRRYDTLIIDEAHERSLTIDFLLGYLHRLLPRRPDLRLVITSATIDPARFSQHFGGAPVIEVSGRTYPVEVRYRPYGAQAEVRDDRDQVEAVLDAVDELWTEGNGDILVFCSGEREIRDTAEALRRKDLPGTEILPLFARLSAAEQHRVFASHPGRRVVLATNVAETSLTVPGIRYVVDPGTARISRYSHRLKVQRLPIEPVSQASAQQRAGRCGRVAAGVCIRLYSEEDLTSRPEFTEPEILRTNLASVILQMAALGLGEVRDFPFLDPPDHRQVRDGLALLHELGALDGGQEPGRAPGPPRLSATGRQLARLPLDPRLARMVLEAHRGGVLEEVLVVAAALSIQDPRERPPDQQERAQQLHARFADKRSDFVAYLNLWHYVREQRKALSSSAFRRLCRAEMLHYLRVREWQDVVTQLRRASKDLGLRPGARSADVNPAVDPAALHQALLSGLLSHIGARDPERRDYLGARGARFALWPGSGLARRPPPWVVAAELVETSRLFGRVAAQVQPEWVEPLAAHLVSRSYSEPHWSANRGAVMAYEQVSLYGLTLVARRRVSYAAVDPATCRDLFIRHALVLGEWRTHHEFARRNAELVREVEELEARTRRRDLLSDEQTRYDFFDARVPETVVSAGHFDRWWKTARREQPDLLTYDDPSLRADGSHEAPMDAFPDRWLVAGTRLALTYQFEPGEADDGVTLHVPLSMVGQVDAAALSWQVPGLREELVTALIRLLPKAVRRSYVPAPSFAAAALAAMADEVGRRDLPRSLAAALGAMGGARVDESDWDMDRLAPYLRMHVAVHQSDDPSDLSAPVVARGTDVTALVRALAPQTTQALGDVVAQAGPDLRRRGLTTWPMDLEELPEVVTAESSGGEVRGYPALVDGRDSVSVAVLAHAAEAAAAHGRGLRRLVQLDLPSAAGGALSALSNGQRLGLAAAPHQGGTTALLADVVDAAVDAVVTRALEETGSDVRSGTRYRALCDRVRPELPTVTRQVLSDVAEILAETTRIGGRLDTARSTALAPVVDDMREQMGRLVGDGFVTAAGSARLADLRRYLRAMDVRLDRAPDRLSADQASAAQVRDLTGEYAEVLAALTETARGSTAAGAVRWMLEELRVSFFAPTLRTAYPISDKRVRRALDDLRRLS